MTGSVVFDSDTSNSPFRTLSAGMRPGSFLPAARVKHGEQSAKGVIRCRSSSGTGRFSFVGTVVIFVLSPHGWRLLYIRGGVIRSGAGLQKREADGVVHAL